MEGQAERGRALAGRAVELYSQVLDRLEAALGGMPVEDVGAEELGQLVAILKGAELSWRGLERVKTGGVDAAKTLLDLMREMDAEDREAEEADEAVAAFESLTAEEQGAAVAAGASAIAAAPVADDSDEGGGQEEEGDGGPDPVAGGEGP